MIRNRIDANHGIIADAFRALGWRVHSTASLKGWCDMTCQHHLRGRVVTLLVEVKGLKGTLTAPQKKLRLDGWWIHTVRTVEDVRALHTTERNSA